MIRQFLTIFLAMCLSISCSTVENVVGELSGFYATSSSTKVVIVGMLNSRKFGRCSGSDVDAETMRKILSNYTKNVTVLRDAQATRAAVMAALTEAAKSDLMIFYYSGHGGSQRQNSATKANWVEPSGSDSYLCLYDAGLLDDDIWSIVSNAKGRVVFIADCCHSGTMFRAPMDFSEQIELMSSSPEARSHETRLLYLGGCVDTSYSYGDANGGLLTNAIKRYFNEKWSYDRVFSLVKKDKSVTGAEAPQLVEIGSSFKAYQIFK